MLYRDEIMGWLQRMDREGHESDRAFYLELWTGKGRLSSDRVGRGFVSHPRCVSVLGSIQPGPFGDYVRAAGRAGRGDDGFVQRFQLAVWPELSEEYQPIDRPPDRESRDRVRALFGRVGAIRPEELGAEQDEGVYYVRFVQDAQTLFRSWLTALERRIRSRREGLSSSMLAHLGKYRGLCPRLALLFHVIDCADVGSGGPVSEDATRRAIGWCAFLEQHARRIYGDACQVGQDELRELAERISRRQLNDGFVARDIIRKGWRALKSPDALQAALDALVGLNWLRAEHRPTAGRGTVEYLINPQVFTMSADRTDKADESLSTGLLPTEATP